MKAIRVFQAMVVMVTGAATGFGVCAGCNEVSERAAAKAAVTAAPVVVAVPQQAPLRSAELPRRSSLHRACRDGSKKRSMRSTRQSSSSLTIPSCGGVPAPCPQLFKRLCRDSCSAQWQDQR